MSVVICIGGEQLQPANWTGKDSGIGWTKWKWKE